MADDDPCMPTRGSMDLIGRELKNFRGRGRGQLPLPKRRRVVDSGGAKDQPNQLALITAIVDDGDPALTGRYISSGLTFVIGNMPVVKFVLLEAGGSAGSQWTVDNPDTLTLAELEVYAYDLRHDGVPVVGEVVRVWADDGKLIQRGEINNTTVEGTEDQPEVDHWVYCDALNATDHLRSLPTWDVATAQLLVHDAADAEIMWLDADVLGDDPGFPIGIPPGGGGDTVAPGYAIDTSGTGTVTIAFDPEEITGHAAAFQIFMHASGETGPTGPNWKTVSGYNAGDTQQLIHVSGTWTAVDAYTVKATSGDTTASHLHDAGNDAVAAGTYSSTQDPLVKNETVGAAATNQKERWFIDASSITNWSATNAQTLGHDNTGALMWINIDPCST